MISHLLKMLEVYWKHFSRYSNATLRYRLRGLIFARLYVQENAIAYNDKTKAGLSYALGVLKVKS